ncbi:MAG: carbonic anhydrase family protein [Anaerolineales bacterium]|uniref:carbonic anhydrase n=1 Tax=Candidatus Villigracilis vicinus TaxID=3140679 RepID=UPI003137228B|nr:carbonic anhydrase family protein [Anaerolineales bacterium]
MKLQKFRVVILLAATLVACAPANEESSHADTSPHWTYEGEEGPEHWGDLDPAYMVCGAGKNQSPIDVASPAEQDLANIVFHYQPSEVNILNNGHTVQVNYDAGSYIELDSIRYDVAQFHYHAPSEHAVDGKLFAAELHIVHKSADGNLAVVGILLDEGAQNDAYLPFTENLPAKESEATDAGVTINAADLLPAEQTSFRYSGSLTTPPCSEGVNWLLMTTPVEISTEQIEALTSLFEEGNNRPVQPLNDRPLTEDSTP